MFFIFFVVIFMGFIFRTTELVMHEHCRDKLFNVGFAILQFEPSHEETINLGFRAV